MSVYLDVTVGDRTFRARALDDRVNRALGALLAKLPITAQVIQDQWSRDFMEVVGGPLLEFEKSDPTTPFQHPGLLLASQDGGGLSICYGQGRLQDGFGPLRAVALAELDGDLSALEESGKALLFEGAKALSVRLSADQETPIARQEPEGRGLIVTLGDARAAAVLLEHAGPAAAEAFARLLPLVGVATNTVSSGPLTRFWNPAGGPEGETPLEIDADSAVQPPGIPAARAYPQQILYPGFMYYLPTKPWRGIRTAFVEATVMKGILAGDSPSLVPLAQFVGDWSAIRAAAGQLRYMGSAPMRIELRPGGA